MKSLTSRKIFFPFFPHQQLTTPRTKSMASFYHWGLAREENCLKAGNLPGSKASLGVVLFYSLLFCCLFSFSSMCEEALSRANNLSCWSFFLNWQNILPLYCYNLMFPEHIDVSIYTKAKWVWKKWFALGAGGSKVCGTLHLNVSSCKIGSVGKQLRKAP